MRSLYAALIFTLGTSVCQGAESWNGRFKLLVAIDNGIRHEKFIEISCPNEIQCRARTSMQVNRQEIKEEPVFSGSSRIPIENDEPFEIDKETTERVKRSVQDLAKIADFPHAPAYYKQNIYRQIAAPDHIQECRARAADALIICRLDKPLASDDLGNLTSWVLILPDMSSGVGCPGYGCPEALVKEKTKR